MSLNESQRAIAETTEGLMVVDAGPGTGKTHTITERYLNIIGKPDVSPQDVLMMTFTNNAATEMEERIKSKMAENGLNDQTKFVLTKTFDAFCMSVVMDSPEMVSQFFKTEHTLTRGAKLSDNTTVNNEYFCQFLDDFLDTNGQSYGDWATLAGEYQLSLLNLINRLMALGVVPMRNGWFADDPRKTLWGDVDKLIADMGRVNTQAKNESTVLAKALHSMKDDEYYNPPEAGKVVDEEILREAAEGDRDGLVEFVHDVYYAYISSSIADNRLTFGLVSIFAFVLLYRYKNIRERNSFKYLMIDEFQDTNANQLMIAMMILTEPNLCVVGDWKQGIYGFRFVSIENITQFESRLVRFRKYLNDDEERVRFRINGTIPKPLNVNYRSSQKIIDKAFETLLVPGSKEEAKVFDGSDIKDSITPITASRTELEEVSDIRYVKCETKEDEVYAVVDAIRDYVTPGRYVVRDRDGDRPVNYSDIAVICRNGEPCRAVMEACTEAGIPAFLHGDIRVMSTREGKLALAWLRYVNNEKDLRGIVPILSDLNYNLAEINKVKNGAPVPPDISKFREELRNKRRRITELLTMMYRFYGLDNDITQSIITTVSTAHRHSLLTISDIIRIIDEDIENETTYPVENSIDSSSVSIMTMHKSKGLEFPIVIAPLIDTSQMPSTKGDSNEFMYDEKLGIRCTKVIGRYEGYSRIFSSWQTKLAKSAYVKDYSEERRLFFVTLSRAKQYETLICSSPSMFMDSLSGGQYTEIPESPVQTFDTEHRDTERPDVSGYPSRKVRLGVHSIMDFGDSGTKNMSECSDEAPGKGKDYGSMIHKIAFYIAKGYTVKEDEEDYPEIPRIRRIIESLGEAKIQPEVECGLPVPGTDAILRGQIDLLADFGDRIEVHDYKTDVSRDFESEYRLQLSVYAHAASQVYGKPAVCVIDYVSRDETERFDPLPMNIIKERVEKHLPQ